MGSVSVCLSIGLSHLSRYAWTFRHLDAKQAKLVSGEFRIQTETKVCSMIAFPSTSVDETHEQIENIWSAR